MKRQLNEDTQVNRYGDYCKKCGRWINPGEGQLHHYTDEEDIDLLGGGNAWVVTHLDRVMCNAYIAQDAAEESAQQAKAEEERAEKIALIGAMIQCKPFEYHHFSQSHLPSILIGEIYGGIDAAVEIISLHDGEVARFFYCADPIAAGVDKAHDGSLSDTSAMFFGE